nr:MAG TPA: hypothetical protein [Caudoviricetes sp.]
MRKNINFHKNHRFSDRLCEEMGFLVSNASKPLK